MKRQITQENLQANIERVTAKILISQFETRDSQFQIYWNYYKDNEIVGNAQKADSIKYSYSRFSKLHTIILDKGDENEI